MVFVTRIGLRKGNHKIVTLLGVSVSGELHAESTYQVATG
jgi:hypothetical protein